MGISTPMTRSGNRIAWALTDGFQILAKQRVNITTGFHCSLALQFLVGILGGRLLSYGFGKTSSRNIVSGIIDLTFILYLPFSFSFNLKPGNSGSLCILVRIYEKIGIGISSLAICWWVWLSSIIKFFFHASQIFLINSLIHLLHFRTVNISISLFHKNYK